MANWSLPDLTLNRVSCFQQTVEPCLIVVTNPIFTVRVRLKIFRNRSKNIEPSSVTLRLENIRCKKVQKGPH